MYYLATNYEGNYYSLEPFESLEELKQRMQEGNIYARYKLFKELFIDVVHHNPLNNEEEK